MSTTLSIGDFSKATHLSVKALRHYHQLGILEPSEVDPLSGYRRYRSDQIVQAQVIRRFRDLDMPLDEIGAVLSAPDVTRRDQVISSHLDRLEAGLERTQASTASLRVLLDPTAGGAVLRPDHVAVQATSAAAIGAEVEMAEAGPWWRGALAEIQANLEAQGVPVTGTAGALLPGEFFANGRGHLTVFVPCAPAFAEIGRVEPAVIPAAELAMLSHAGSHSEIDLAYGALADYVSSRALAVDGPIREYYVAGPHTGADEANWQTRIGWPIFRTSARTASDDT
jgi:DNA-binding transcriptional MerR regulator/effector-binding domain-containing protein